MMSTMIKKERLFKMRFMGHLMLAKFKNFTFSLAPHGHSTVFYCIYVLCSISKNSTRDSRAKIVLESGDDLRELT